MLICNSAASVCVFVCVRARDLRANNCTQATHSFAALSGRPRQTESGDILAARPNWLAHAQSLVTFKSGCARYFKRVRALRSHLIGRVLHQAKERPPALLPLSVPASFKEFPLCGARSLSNSLGARKSKLASSRDFTQLCAACQHAAVAPASGSRGKSS